MALHPVCFWMVGGAAMGAALLLDEAPGAVDGAAGYALDATTG